MKKKLLSIVLTLCMVVTMIPLFAGTVFAGTDPSFTYTGPDGKSVTITATEVNEYAGDSQTFYQINKKGKKVEPGVSAKFAKLSALLENKGATLPECSFSIPAGSGDKAYTFGYTPDTDLYIYVEEGAFNTAVNMGYGFLWAKGFTTINGKNHVFGDKFTCTNSITYFNPDLPDGGGKDEKPCGAVAPADSSTPEVTFTPAACTWNGKVQQPAVTVKVGGNTLKEGTDYTVSYAGGRKNVGSYTATVTCKGHYTGSKTASFDIIPKGTSLSKVKAAKKRVTVRWKKQTKKMSTSGITGYQIQYSKKKNFSSGNKAVKVKGAKKTSKKITKLQSKKTYYVRIRTYKKVGSKTFYSTWSKAKKVRVK